MEQWKHIEGTDDAYVSNLGRIKQDERIIEPRIDPEGYLRVTINGIRERIHRIAATAWIENKENKPMVNHINGIKDDNRVENLEWCTPKENAEHAGKTGLLGDPKEKRYNRIIVINNNTKEGRIYNSQSEAAKKLGIDDSEVNKCLKNKRQLSHGHSFAYLIENN